MKKTTKKKLTPRKKDPKPANHIAAHDPLPVVGIGASAGGLEAFSRMLSHLPPDTDMAYIYIQHLDPGHKSILTEIFERKTRMAVLTVKDGMLIKKNHIYVIPSNRYMTVKRGRLRLQAIVRTGVGNHAIDFFFNSLAATYQGSAIGVVLSGASNDGTQGLKAIKAEGGITFAQDDTAKYQAMPRSAVDSGFVDFVMPPERIARELATVIRHPSFTGTTPLEYISNGKDEEFKKIIHLLNARRKVDFSHYKTNTVHRRILRRMILNRFKKPGEYTHFLKSNNAEMEALYQDLLIHVTTFFRDPKVFQNLRSKVWPALFKNRPSKDPLRIWIPGCSTGEEAYSVAISLYEYLHEKRFVMPVQIFSTDLNELAIERARLGIYIKSALQNVSPQHLRRYFIRINGNYQIIKSIRDVSIFAPHNLLKDPPFSHMDLISCQNVLIYMEQAAQQKVLQSFHYALKPTGMLLLGKSESIGSTSDLFKALDKDHRIYIPKPAPPHFNFDFAMSALPEVYSTEEPNEQVKVTRQTALKSEDNLEKEIDRMLLAKYVPASVIVNSDYDIIRFRGNTSPYLQPASGRASLNLTKMVRDELAYDLRALLLKAKKENTPIRKDALPLSGNGNSSEVSLEVVPIHVSGKQTYFLIIFHSLQAYNLTDDKKGGHVMDNKSRRILILEKQLKEEREHLKSVSEEFEATREELQSANEEVLSSNEELQSINEELETSKEELQSSVEELTTINEELLNRNEELRTSRDYAEAMVSTTREPIIVLSYDLRVHSANKAFYKFFRTSPEELAGHFLSEADNELLDVVELRKQLRAMRSNLKQTLSFEINYTSYNKEKRLLHVNAHALELKEGKQQLVLLAIQDFSKETG